MGSDSEDKNNEHSLGMSHKVMLAAAVSLFGIVMLMIFLHFVARYLIRLQQRRRQTELHHQINTQIAPIDVSLVETPNSGLDPLIIASLPKLLYKQTDQFIKGEEAVECSVCLCNILEDASTRVLPNCKHIFHVDCVDKWFGSNTTCPICRTFAEPKVSAKVQTGHDDLATWDHVEATAPPVEDEPQVGCELEKVGCSGLRIGSFHRMVN